MSGHKRWIARWTSRLGEGALAQDVSLAEHTTLRVGGPADVLAVVTRADVLASLVLDALDSGMPVTVLGGGSNVLVADAGVRGLVVLNRCRGYDLYTGPDGRPRVRAEAGVPLAGLARALIRQGLDGLTWAVSIPGTVGGAVVGNAGAHGGCVADVLETVTLLDETGQVRELAADEMAFAYRTSRLKVARRQGQPLPLVLAATFRLRRGEATALQRQAEAFLAYRRRTQPTEPSVGSIFRNPNGAYAGQLIEAAGLKGVRVGDAMISPVHANFIVNLGQARAVDIFALLRLAQQHVAARFGVHLEPEILLLGDWDAVEDGGRGLGVHTLEHFVSQGW